MGVHVLCAETEAEARRLATSRNLAKLKTAWGNGVACHQSKLPWPTAIVPRSWPISPNLAAPTLTAIRSKWLGWRPSLSNIKPPTSVS